MAEHVCLKPNDLKASFDDAKNKEERAAMVKKAYEQAGSCVFCRRVIWIALS